MSSRVAALLPLAMQYYWLTLLPTSTATAGDIAVAPHAVRHYSVNIELLLPPILNVDQSLYAPKPIDCCS